MKSRDITLNVLTSFFLNSESAIITLSLCWKITCTNTLTYIAWDTKGYLAITKTLFLFISFIRVLMWLGPGLDHFSGLLDPGVDF